MTIGSSWAPRAPPSEATPRIVYLGQRPDADIYVKESIVSQVSREVVKLIIDVNPIIYVPLRLTVRRHLCIAIKNSQ